MISLNDERSAAWSVNSSTESRRGVDLGDVQETMSHAFSAKPKAFFAAIALQFQSG